LFLNLKLLLLDTQIPVKVAFAPILANVRLIFYCRADRFRYRVGFAQNVGTEFRVKVPRNLLL
jgi:hypothetical protein